MIDAKCKKCRRIGEKLFLKGDKCSSGKCPITRRPYPPGVHGKKRRKGDSEFGSQLKQKQKVKFSYGLRERQFSNYAAKAMKDKSGKIASILFSMLEDRLDNVIRQGGFADSIISAKQLITHGHIMVNGKRRTSPSYQVKIGDKVGIRVQSLGNKLFKDIDAKMKKVSAPNWINLDKNKKELEIVGQPDIASSGLESSIKSLLEFYSR